MSSNLCWEPVRSEHKTFGTALKFLLREHYQISQGPVTLSESCRQWFLGVAAGSNDEELKKDIAELLEAIEKYGEVKLWEQY